MLYPIELLSRVGGQDGSSVSRFEASRPEMLRAEAQSVFETADLRKQTLSSSIVSERRNHCGGVGEPSPMDLHVETSYVRSNLPDQFR